MSSALNNWSSTAANQRPTNWRYRQAAADAAQNRFRLPGHADGDVRALTRLLRDGRRSAGDAQAAAAADPQFEEEFPWLKLFRNREEACRIESLLLAGLDDAAIGKRLKLDDMYVGVYHDCFFEVRPQRSDAHYIISYAIRPEASVGEPETVQDRVAMKTAAYFCGLPALEKWFFFEKRNDVCPWGHPADTVRRLAAVNYARQFADLVLGTPSASGPEFGAAIEDLCAWLEVEFPGDYPTQPFAYAVQKDQVQTSAFSERASYPNR